MSCGKYRQTHRQAEGLSSTKKWGILWGKHKCGEQRFEVSVRNSFTVVNLQDLRSNCTL